jgi:hypothetical protein
MTKTSNGLPLTIPLEIPAYWTPEQAFAVVELLDDLRDRIWAHYSSSSTNTASSTDPPTVITLTTKRTILEPLCR